MAAGAKVGDRLYGMQSCALAPTTRGANGLLNGIGRITSTSSNTASYPSFGITFPTADSVETDINGFGGTRFTANELRRATGLVSQYLDSQPYQGFYEQFDIARRYRAVALGDTTFGLNTGYMGLCLYVAGLPVTDWLAWTEYNGFADGFVQTGGATERLYGSLADARIAADGTGVATVTLAALPVIGLDTIDPSAPPNGRAAGTLTIRFARAPRGVQNVTISGPEGFTGQAWGDFYGPYATGLGFGFALRNPAGDTIFGVVAMDARQI